MGQHKAAPYPYAFYNAPLISIAMSSNEASLGFVDDTMFLAIGNTLNDAHAILKDMMKRSEGGFQWSITHNPPFELSKLALMDFLRSSCDPIPPNLTITRHNTDSSLTSQIVTTTTMYKYLGVMFDPSLRWNAHFSKVTAPHGGPSKSLVYQESLAVCPQIAFANYTIQ